MIRSVLSLPSLRRRYVFTAGLFLIAGLAFLTKNDVLAEGIAGQANDSRISKAVTALLLKDHLTKHPLDVEISNKTLKAYLKGLDPMKLYFTAADVEEFGQKKDVLCDLARAGDVSMGYAIYNRFLARIDERVKLIDTILAQDIDFTVDEELTTEADQTVYAKTDADFTDKWRKRIKYDLLTQMADKKTIVEAKEKIGRRYHSFAKRIKQTKSDEVLEGYLTAMTMCFDPHTTYMSPSTLDNFDIMMRLRLEGIGASLQFDDGYTVVKQLIPGGAADKQGGLKVQDRVVGVGQGNNGEFVDVVDMNLNEVVTMIRGEKGTIVRLKVIPVGMVEPKIIPITRASIELKDSEARSEIIDFGKKANGTPFHVGYIDLPSFYLDMEGARLNRPDYKSTTRDMRKILQDFNQKQVDVVVLSLRRNGGGSLTEAISLTGLFIDEGPVVQIKDPDHHVKHYDDEERGVDWAGPLVVVTDKFSASASEIFAAAIQDYHRGLVIGDHQTHGKGTVQSLLDLSRQLFPGAPKLGALKITIQQFYRPAGDSTQEQGVVADVEIPSLSTHLDVGEKDLDNHLKFDHVDPVPFHKVDLVDSNMVGEMQNLSKDRCDKSPDFDKVRKKIERYKQVKEKKTVTLNEQKFMAERNELNSDKEDEKEFEEQTDPKRPVVKKDYYFNESMNITLDYLRLLKKGGVAKN